jgi:hypothetical protein
MTANLDLVFSASTELERRWPKILDENAIGVLPTIAGDSNGVSAAVAEKR